jgi:hypothetical protein
MQITQVVKEFFRFQTEGRYELINNVHQKINVMCFRFPSAFCNWINPFAIESMILSRIVVSLIALIITLVALVIIVAMKI